MHIVKYGSFEKENFRHDTGKLYVRSEEEEEEELFCLPRSDCRFQIVVLQI